MAYKVGGSCISAVEVSYERSRRRALDEHGRDFLYCSIDDCAYNCAFGSIGISLY